MCSLIYHRRDPQACLPFPPLTLRKQGLGLIPAQSNPSRRTHSLPKLSPFTEHSQRQKLTDEVHSRPPADVPGPMVCTHLAFLTGENGFESERTHLRELAALLGAKAPGEFGNHLVLELGKTRLVWERHTEFSTYTFYEALAADTDPADAFSRPPLSRVPERWKEKLTGELLVAINLVVTEGESAEMDPHLSAIFDDHRLVGAGVAGGSAAVWTDLTIKPDGFSRLLIANRNLRPSRMGRLVQRLLEIETYRMMALLAFPLARALAPEISRMEEELARIATETASISGLADEQRQLQELTSLAAKVEQLTARTDFRFSAARAYYELVTRRIGELDERKLPGLQQIATFMERRLAPAMRTSEAIERRLDTLSQHIARASSLLRTRVEIAVQEQNQSLLASMEKRVRLQLRLQETVEGLSAVAISYYLLGIIHYALEAAHETGLPVDPALSVGILAPFMLIAVFLGVRSVRKRLKAD